MSLLPSPGSLVRLHDGRVGVVTKLTPKGDDDRVWVGTEEVSVTFLDIAELICDSDDWKQSA